MPTTMKTSVSVDPNNLDDVPVRSFKMVKILAKRIALGVVVTVGVTALSVVALVLIDKAVDSAEFHLSPNHK